MKIYQIVVSILLVATTLFAANDSPVQHGARVMPLVHHDLSRPLREIPPIPIIQGPRRVVPNKPLPLPQPNPNEPVTGGLDPGLQTFSGPAMPAPINSWDGLGVGFSGPQGTFTVFYAPPDTNGDVGPNHIVQTVNVGFAIWNKSGTVLYGPVNINTLWSGFGGGCQNNNDGDPVVIYDQFNDRWIISQFSVSTTPYLQCVAVSQTGDPTGSYYRFSYSYSNLFNDYPKLGVWAGNYYITYNMFLNGNSFFGGEACAFDGAKLRAGQANSMQCFTENNGGLLPADIDGTSLPPGGAPEYVMSFGSNALNIFKMKIDFNNAANSTFTGPISVSVNSFSPACGGGTCITQPGTNQQLDSLADRLMYRLAYRNRNGTESFVVNHSVAVSGVSAIRWYELRTTNSNTTTPSLFQQGTYSPDTNHRWMGSIAMDQDGNIATGYSVSSSANNVKPTIRYAGRLSSDPLGQLSQGESTLITGTGVQTSGLNRWGDYSSIDTDPSDYCKFWFTTEYLTANGTFNWHTRIGSFKFATCGGGGSDITPPTTSITAPSSGATLSGTTAVSANANDNVGVTKVEFYANSILIGTDTTSPYSINWNTTGVGNGGYNLTSKAYDAAANSATSASVPVTVNNGGGASCSSSQLLANPGFESGNVNWTTTPSTGVIGTSTIYDPARTGSWRARLGGKGVANTSSIYQQISIPANACDATFSLWALINSNETTTTAQNDKISVQVLNTSNAVLATLATYSNLNKGGGYSQKVFDLLPYKGQTIRIKFVETENGSLKTSFLIDDASLNVITNGLSSCSASQVFLNPGFESGNVNWITNPATGVIGNTTIYDPARTGSWRAKFGGKAVANTSSMYQQISIPSGVCVATLSFYERLTSNETTTTLQNDKFQVQVLNSSGSLLQTLATYSNLNVSNSYIVKLFNLLPFKGQTIRINFTGSENSSLKTTFLVDDTSLKLAQ